MISPARPHARFAARLTALAAATLLVTAITLAVTRRTDQIK